MSETPSTSQKAKAISTSVFYKSNILTLHLNGNITISEKMMLAVLPACNHCLKVGATVLPFVKGKENIVYLEHEENQLPFRVEKIDGRYFLSKLEKKEYGLLRFISTAEGKAQINNMSELHVIAENMSLHQDIIYLFKTGDECSLKYSVKEIISKDKQITGIRENTYKDKIVLSQSMGFMLKRKTC